ncbi:MAG: LysR family transcriptional regulator [Desulfitobacteriaceae bacterium]
MFDQEFLTFKTVAETGNITSAAKRLHMSQPGVSLQIHNLESYYGVRFFDRTRKGVSLTPCGKIFYDYVCNVVNLSCSIQQQLSDFKVDHHGTVNLGTTLTIGEYLMPNILAHLCKMRPEVDFKVRLANTEKIFEDILEKELHIGLVDGPVPQNKDIRSENFWQDELVVVVPFDHPLGEQSCISLEELCAERLIVQEVGSGTRKVVELYLQEHGVDLTQLNIAMEIGSTRIRKEMVAAGLGVTIISDLTVKKECEQKIFRMLRIQGSPIMRTFSVLTNTQAVQSKEEHDFIQFLHDIKRMSEVLITSNDPCH